MTSEGAYAPKTILESVEILEEFFLADMWHASREEWKEEEDMQKYLKAHFKICKEEIKKLISSCSGCAIKDLRLTEAEDFIRSKKLSEEYTKFICREEAKK